MAALRYTVDGSDERHEVGDGLSLGRGAENDVDLRGTSGVSRRHARVFRDGEGYRVEDLGSRNGTRIERGGESIRVGGAVALEDGDVLRLGDVRLTFDAAAAPPVRAATYVPAVTRVGAAGAAPTPSTLEAPPLAPPRRSWLPIAAAALAVGGAAAGLAVAMAALF